MISIQKRGTEDRPLPQRMDRLFTVPPLRVRRRWAPTETANFARSPWRISEVCSTIPRRRSGCSRVRWRLARLRHAIAFERGARIGASMASFSRALRRGWHLLRPHKDVLEQGRR